MRLNPKHLSISELLHQRLFRIPDFQRAYAWQAKQRKELFSDILEVHKSGQDHFMATVVCLAREKERIGADEFSCVEIVDGQQRITTFVILFKAIELALVDDGGQQANLKREIGNLLVKGDDHSLLLLQTNHDSSHIFTDFMRKGIIPTEPAQTTADQNLIDATTECEQFVRSWSQESSLVELVALLRHRLSIIYHELQEEASVYRVFEVLNSRGLDVKWIDKVKSQFMALIFTHADKSARSDAIREMRILWADIYRTLGLRSDVGDEAVKFAGTWLSPTRPNRILGEEEASKSIVSFAGTKLRSIVEAAQFLKQVVVTVSELHDDRRLSAVTRISHARFLGAALFRRKYEDPAKKKLLLNQWERVSFRIFGLHWLDPRHEVGEYVRLAYDIENGDLSTKQILDQLKLLGAKFPVSKVLEEIDWADCYTGWTEELRYLLFRYEEHLAAEAGEKIDLAQWNKIWSTDPSKSIEHVIPQSSKKSFIHHLGNLVMLPPGLNSSLQDKKPIEKLAAYRECGLRGTVAVAETIKRKKSWNRNLILDRAKKIEKFVRSEWAD